jgi:signal transduction histidine kinase
MPFKINILIIVFCLSNVVGISQGDSLSYHVELVAPELINSIPNLIDVVEGKNGYLWFSGFNGLTCYDGQQLIHYNSAGDEDKMIISTEGSGFVRLVTADSVFIWLDEFESYDLVCFNVLTRQQVKRIPKDNTDFVFLAADDKSVYSLTKFKGENGIEIENLSEPAEKLLLREFPFEVLKYEYMGNFHWVQTKANGIFKIDQEGKMRQHFPLHQETTFFEKWQDTLYLSRTTQSIAYAITTSSDTLFQIFDLPPSLKKTNHKCFKHHDKIWCVNYQRSIKVIDLKTGHIEDYGLLLLNLANEKAPNSLKFDFDNFLPLSNGDMLAYSYNSIVRFSKKGLSKDYFKEAINTGRDLASMRGLAEGEDGTIYASYYTGLSEKLPNGKFKEFRNTNTIPKYKENSYSLTLKDSFLLWNHSLFNLKSGNDTLFYYDKHGSHINHIIEKDTVWMFFWFINQWGKLELPSKKITILKKPIFDEQLIVSKGILDQEQNGFYLSTNVAGILHINRKGDIIDRIDLKQLNLPFDADYVYDLFLKGDTLWFGSEVGLGYLDLKSKKSAIIKCPVIEENGQSIIRQVYSIIEDEKGNFYLGSSYGLIYFDRHTHEVFQLDNGHPLFNKEFNRNSTLKTKEGKYYMGTVNGLYSFYPEELSFLSVNLSVHPPFINQISIRNKDEKKNRNFYSSLNEKLELKLKPNDYSIKVNFSPSEVGRSEYYSYRLSTFGDQWNYYFTDTHLENYALPSGTYSLDIQATLDPKFPSQEFVSIAITKPKIWYQRLWVQALFVLGILGIGFSFIRYRYDQKLKRQKEIETLRTRISSDLHDEVGSTLTGLAMQSEMMTYELEGKQKESLDEMAEMSRDALDRMRDTVWAIDSRKDTYKSLLARMHSFAEKNLNRQTIEYHFDVAQIDMNAMINPEKRQQIYLIFKEAITNIIKHSNAKMVRIKMHSNPKGFHLVIHDNGSQEINLTNLLKADGQGISNIKMRAETVGGTVAFVVKDGLQVKLTIPET